MSITTKTPQKTNHHEITQSHHRITQTTLSHPNHPETPKPTLSKSRVAQGLLDRHLPGSSKRVHHVSGLFRGETKEQPNLNGAGY